MWAFWSDPDPEFFMTKSKFFRLQIVTGTHIFCRDPDPVFSLRMGSGSGPKPDQICNTAVQHTRTKIFFPFFKVRQITRCCICWCCCGSFCQPCHEPIPRCIYWKQCCGSRSVLGYYLILQYPDSEFSFWSIAVRNHFKTQDIVVLFLEKGIPVPVDVL